MKRIQVSKNFFLDELVDVITYTTEPDNGLSKLDPVAIDVLQLLRTIYGRSIGVNNWWSHWMDKRSTMTVNDFYKWVDSQSKVYQSSGYRAPFCKIGAKYSAHRKGKAFDPKGNQDVYYRIVEENSELFYNTGLRRLEDPGITNGWLHLDTLELNHVVGKIRVIGRTAHTKDISI